MAFKMRGNPMKRNFGISPMKNYKDGYYKDDEVSGFKKNVTPSLGTIKSNRSWDDRYGDQVETAEEYFNTAKENSEDVNIESTKNTKKQTRINRRKAIKDKLKNIDFKNMFNWMRNLKG